MYDGPIIDAHHHLWDLSSGHYPWLTAPGAGIAALGDIEVLKRDYLPDDYALDIDGEGIAASVHVEAAWDPARSPVEETLWLETLERPDGIAARYVVAAPLTTPDLAALLDAHEAASKLVAGVRETIRWHPDPAKRWTRQGIIAEPEWRRGLAELTRRGLPLELLMNPHQALELAALAAATPEQVFIVNHCGTPNDRDEAGMARWRDGLAAMAGHANIGIKLSNYGAYTPKGSREEHRDTLRTVIDAFGPERCMFGSDYPVAKRTMTYPALVRRFSEIAAEYDAAAQEALFWRTAARVYGISL